MFSSSQEADPDLLVRRDLTETFKAFPAWRLEFSALIAAFWPPRL